MPILWTDDVPELAPEPPRYRRGDLHILCNSAPCHCVDSGRVAEYLIGIGFRPAQLGRLGKALSRP